MNKVILQGRLTRDPEERISGEMAITKFGIAVDRKFKRDGEPTADFFNCTAFGKMAEVISKYFAKGNKITVAGRIATSNYTDKEGNKKNGFEIIVEDFDFCESKGNKDEGSKGDDSINGFEIVTEETPAELPF